MAIRKFINPKVGQPGKKKADRKDGVRVKGVINLFGIPQIYSAPLSGFLHFKEIATVTEDMISGMKRISHMPQFYVQAHWFVEAFLNEICAHILRDMYRNGKISLKEGRARMKFHRPLASNGEKLKSIAEATELTIENDRPELLQKIHALADVRDLLYHSEFREYEQNQVPRAIRNFIEICDVPIGESVFLLDPWSAIISQPEAITAVEAILLELINYVAGKLGGPKYKALKDVYGKKNNINLLWRSRYELTLPEARKKAEDDHRRLSGVKLKIVAFAISDTRAGHRFIFFGRTEEKLPVVVIMNKNGRIWRKKQNQSGSIEAKSISMFRASKKYRSPESIMRSLRKMGFSFS